jgi:hypothetical protein
MTSLTALETDNFLCLTSHLLLAAGSGLVSDLATVTTNVYAAVKRNASVFESGKIVFGVLGPLGYQSGTLSLVRGEVTDSILLASFSLEVDICQGFAMILFLHHRLACYI